LSLRRSGSACTKKMVIFQSPAVALVTVNARLVSKEFAWFVSSVNVQAFRNHLE